MLKIAKKTYYVAGTNSENQTSLSKHNSSHKTICSFKSQKSIYKINI